MPRRARRARRERWAARRGAPAPREPRLAAPRARVARGTTTAWTVRCQTCPTRCSPACPTSGRRPRARSISCCPSPCSAGWASASGNRATTPGTTSAAATRGSSQTSYGVNVCAQTALIPAHQECADAEDGYEFLVMHRHMIQGLRAGLPHRTPTLFDGFPHFPFNATDVPQEWQSALGHGLVAADHRHREDARGHREQPVDVSDRGRSRQVHPVRRWRPPARAASTARCTSSGWSTTRPTRSASSPSTSTTTCSGSCTAGSTRSGSGTASAKGLTADEPKLQQTLTTSAVEMHDARARSSTRRSPRVAEYAAAGRARRFPRDGAADPRADLQRLPQRDEPARRTCRSAGTSARPTS